MATIAPGNVEVAAILTLSSAADAAVYEPGMSLVGTPLAVGYPLREAVSAPGQPDFRIAFCRCGGSWDTTVGVHPCPACVLKERLRAENQIAHLRKGLELIRDSNRHAKFCTYSRDKRRPAACSPGCPVIVAYEALRAAK